MRKNNKRNKNPEGEGEGKTFGERLQIYRRRRSITQEKLGDEVGLSKSAISRYENGKSYPDPDTLVLICKVLGMTPNEFLGIHETNDNGEIGELLEGCDKYEREHLLRILRFAVWENKRFNNNN